MEPAPVNDGSVRAIVGLTQIRQYSVARQC